MSRIEPALRAACGGRLGSVQWFHAAWAAGGAATGYATLEDPAAPPAGRAHDVFIKLPVGATEYAWTTATGAGDDDHEGQGSPTLRVHAHGHDVAGEPLAWLIMERLSGPSLRDGFRVAPCTQAVNDVLHAAARWYKSAAAVRSPLEGARPAEPDYEGQVGKARDSCKANHFEGAQHWNDVLKRVGKALPRLLDRWRARPIDTWCHGDLHPGNVMRRGGGADGKPGACVLLDFALVHPGHWVEDAVYFERQFWAYPEVLSGVKPVSVMARARRELGLACTGDYAELANIRRILMGATAPAFLQQEGRPRYLKAALEQVERLLPQV